MQLVREGPRAAGRDTLEYSTTPGDIVKPSSDWLPQVSPYDTVTQCEGVCRDFAHLGIALCRAVTIPTRYFTGYAYRLEPPDFHACLEASIGGYWVLFDATRLAPPNGLV
jgi:transglutaminase-like putative cysteine protease